MYVCMQNIQCKKYPLFTSAKELPKEPPLISPLIIANRGQPASGSDLGASSWEHSGAWQQIFWREIPEAEA